MISILDRDHIDEIKWNLTIKQAVSNLPYAYTWYLDAVCSGWIALVVGDYEFVMPLPIGRKWGLRYVYQPLFCQQLGVFYRRYNKAIIELMVATAIRKFIFVNININCDNYIKSAIIETQTPKKNLILDLNSDYSVIQKGYHENARRNIRKGRKAGLRFEEGDTDNFNAFADFYIKYVAGRDHTFKPTHTGSLHRLVRQFALNNCGKLYTAKTAEGNICAGVIVIENNNRVIHLVPASDEYARQNGGMHFLVDEVLRHYAGSGKIYDFEGSSVDSIARFYEGFGAINEPFGMISKSVFKFLKNLLIGQEGLFKSGHLL